MATRSTIWLKKDDGTFTGIYCHWDGYPSHNGKILLEHYNTEEKVEALVALGSLSSLAPSIECPEGHSFEKPIDGYSVAYARDRGEDFKQWKQDHPFGLKNCFEEYNYFFFDGKWHLAHHAKEGGIKFNDLLLENCMD